MKIAIYKTAKVGWVLEYNEGKIQTATASRIGGNIAGGRKMLERIFNHFANQRESAGLKNRFIHMKLSLSPLDQQVSSGTFRTIVKKVLNRLGLDHNLFIIYRHYDTDHPHIHIVISRVTFKGKLVRDSFDGLILREVERDLDKEYNLTPSATRLITPKGVRLSQKWEKERSERTGTKSVRSYVQNGIIEALQDRPSLTIFVKRLERRGIKIWHREFDRNGRIYHGLSYTLDPEMLSIRFKNKDPKGRAAGISEADLDRLSSKQPVEVNHSYFGKVMARLVTNLRGVPEFCLNHLRPDNKMKPYSFRALNLGPLFQYPSIISHLSSIEPDTMRHITLQTKKKPVASDYKRSPLTALEAGLSRLLLAAEFKSQVKVEEALKGGFKLSEIDQLDRTATEEEKSFIRVIMEASARRADGQIAQQEVSLYSDMIFRFTSLTGEQPSVATIDAIRLIAEKNWPALQTFINEIQNSGSREKAPHSSIMYLGIPSTLSLQMMDYHSWYSEESDGFAQDEESAKRKKIYDDTEMLLGALKIFDDQQVKLILANDQPDVSRIPLEHLGKVADPLLAQQLKTLALVGQVKGLEVSQQMSPPKLPDQEQVQEKNKGHQLG